VQTILPTPQSLAACALIWSLGACGQGSTGAGEGEDTSSASSSSSASSGPSTSNATFTTNASATFTDGAEACDDECEIGDIGEQSCNIVAQNCPNTYKCAPFWPDLASVPDYRCVAIRGDLEPGDPCTIDSLATGNDDCDDTGFCWSYGTGQLEGRCHPYCTGGFQYAECIDGWTCSFSDVNPPMCVQTCVPLTGDCGSGLQCLWADPHFSCMLEGAGLGPGEPCSVANDCAPDSLCVDALSLASCAGDACCTPYCAVTAGDSPCQMIDPGYACAAFFEDPAPLGLEDVGVCMLP
jgi:hypothetical protein